MSSLVDRVQAKKAELGRRAISEMYQNPFWHERFGTRGREMSDKDSQFHLSYLVEALVASEPSVLARYARWLQTLLVSRGMCSRHISENFERLAHAIADEINEPEPALELLRAACQALIYDSGPARELMLCADPLAERVVDALTFESVHPAERARCKSDVLDYISYLADAVHAQRAELFAAHAAWMQGFAARRQAPSSRVEEVLNALSDCLPDVSPELAAAARATLGAALDRLVRGAGALVPHSAEEVLR